MLVGPTTYKGQLTCRGLTSLFSPFLPYLISLLSICSITLLVFRSTEHFSFCWFLLSHLSFNVVRHTDFQYHGHISHISTHPCSVFTPFSPLSTLIILYASSLSIFFNTLKSNPILSELSVTCHKLMILLDLFLLVWSSLTTLTNLYSYLCMVRPW